MIRITSERYREYAAEAVRDKRLKGAIRFLQDRIGKGAAKAIEALPEGRGLRMEGKRIRREAVESLDILLPRLAQKVRENGGKVFFAEDGKAAADYCIRVAREHRVKLAVKGKSMVTEEIGLNAALEAAGITAVETDLGEYIIQLAGEHPSHIIAPAIHKTKEEIGALFAEKLEIPYTDDPPSLTRAARKALREKLLTAGMGITSCNMACAETGHISLVSNEGNIRMATTMPKVHVAFMGMERIAARLEDHHALVRLLTRGAAAQKLSTYVSYVSGPATEEQEDGPTEFHLVILDGGRSRILADERFREVLRCLRCGACLNVCPVYAQIGGHSYGSPYPGPIGSVITPLLFGVNRAAHLCQGESLCGACKNACPVDIDLPRMLLELRAMLADGDEGWGTRRKSSLEKGIFRAWSRLIEDRRRYALFLKGAAMAEKLLPRKRGMIRRLPPPFNGWTETRDLPPLAPKTFMERWKEEREKRTE